MPVLVIVPLFDALAGLVERRHEPDLGGELRLARAKRCQSPISRWIPSAVSVSMPRNARSRATVGQSSGVEAIVREALGERVSAGDQAVDRGQRVDIDELESRAPRSAAATSHSRWACVHVAVSARIDASVAQQQLRDAVAGAHQIATDLLAGAHDVARGLLPRLGHADRSQADPPSAERTNSSASRRSVLIRSPAARGVLRRRDHIHRDPAARARARQAIAGRSRLIHRRAPAPARQPASPPPAPVHHQTEPAKAPRYGIHRRRLRRPGMDIPFPPMSSCSSWPGPPRPCGQPRPLLGQTNPRTDDEGLAGRIRPQPEPA